MMPLHSVGALTAPAEDYLKAIYDIERAAPGESVATTELAQRLAIAPASVTGMVKRLADQGLIDHEPYRGVRLTGRGRLAALRTLRRHRVIEAYLAQALGYAWDRVHDEAERLARSWKCCNERRTAARLRCSPTARRGRSVRSWLRR